MFDSMFGRSFNSAKCKTLLRLAISRIKLLRNKRDIQLKQMKRDLGQLLQTNQDPSARIRVEHIYREQNIMAAYEIIELFCELLVVRLPIIDSQKQCPIDLREAVASLIFAAPRCSDVPELLQVRNLLAAKYGKEFVVAAAELRPDCGVNRLVIEKLSVRAPPGDVKLKLMKDIADEQNVNWDPTASESELLKAPEDLLEGPTRFLGASQMSLETPDDEPSTHEQVVELQHKERSNFEKIKAPSFRTVEATPDEKQFIPFVLPAVGEPSHHSKNQSTSPTVNPQTQEDVHDDPPHIPPPTSVHMHMSFTSDCGDTMQMGKASFKDVVSAARAAAESAERAAAAARAAASLASQRFEKTGEESTSESESEDGDITSPRQAGSSKMRSEFSSFNNYSGSEKPLFDKPEDGEGSHDSTRGKASWKENADDDTSMARQSIWGPVIRANDDHGLNGGTSSLANRHFEKDRPRSFGAGPHLDTQQTNDMDTQPEEVAPTFQEAEINPFAKTASKAPYVHPKLPDYDDLTARFEALRSKQ